MRLRDAFRSLAKHGERLEGHPFMVLPGKIREVPRIKLPVHDVHAFEQAADTAVNRLGACPFNKTCFHSLII